MDHTYPHTINNTMILKFETDWDDHDKKMTQLNIKAINIIFCALDVNEFNKILTCTFTKKNWDRSKVTDEEINQVKDSKINMLVHKYKLFKIESDETITGMFTHFTNIMNN